MGVIQDHLSALVLGSATETLHGAIPDGDMPRDQVLATQDQRHGDYQSNLAFRLAKLVRRPPRALAGAIVEAFPRDPALARLEVAGPGFVNITLDDRWLGEQLLGLVADPHLGVPQSGRNKLVVIDYGSPNVAKRMHVGHLRSTIIGNALVGLHRASGFRVIGDNHLGDWGTQFGKLIVAWRTWGSEDAFRQDPLEELQRLYVKFDQEARRDPAMDENARVETARLQAGDAQNRELWRRFVRASMQEFQKVYERLGVRFDAMLGESFYQDQLNRLLEDLLRDKVAIVDDGALIIPFDESDGKGLSRTPMLVRKRDGAALYATTDLATIRYREAQWSPDRILYVTDTRQQLHFRQLFAAARKLRLTPAELIHVWFGVLTLPEGSMSSRRGNVVRLVDLLDEAVRRARQVVDQKSPHLSESERAEIAETVGVSAVKYADLSQNPQSNVTFHWDRMLSLDGDTAPFLLYSLARCRSIQRKAGGAAQWDAEKARLLPGHPLERDLVLALCRYPEALRSALNASRPNTLCEYLFGLAGTFNRFYGCLPVLKAESVSRSRRLMLVGATAQVLSAGLGVLGLGTLERM